MKIDKSQQENAYNDFITLGDLIFGLWGFGVLIVPFCIDYLITRLLNVKVLKKK
jgi:hypothetical protein